MTKEESTTIPVRWSRNLDCIQQDCVNNGTSEMFATIFIVVRRVQAREEEKCDVVIDHQVLRYFHKDMNEPADLGFCGLIYLGVPTANKETNRSGENISMVWGTASLVPAHLLSSLLIHCLSYLALQHQE